MQTGPLSISLAIAFLGATGGWFVLLKRMFDRLEHSHPAKFEALGKPSLVSATSTGPAVIAFLILRQHRFLGDRSLSRLADSMLLYLFGYVILVFFIVRLSAYS